MVTNMPLSIHELIEQEVRARRSDLDWELGQRGG
jgi:hypothetical protein